MMPVTDGKKSAKHSVQSGSTVTTPVVQPPSDLVQSVPHVLSRSQCAVMLISPLLETARSSK